MAKVKPGVLIKVLSPAKVMGPVTEAAVAAVLNKEPEEKMPVPDTDSALAIVMPFMSSAVPLDTVMVPVPSAPLVTIEDRSIELTQRHAEIMTLLAWNRSGLSAERLSELLWGDSSFTARLRAEMVRLRKLLDKFHPGIAPESKPYRLPEQVEIDAQQVVALLDRGAHRAALSAFRGALLPDSVSPGIEEIREEVRLHLRESLLNDASVEVLMDYANTDQGLDDLEVWHQVLKMLPAKSPKRSHVVAHVENLVFVQGS